MRCVRDFGLTGFAGFSQYLAISTGDFGPLPLIGFTSNSKPNHTHVKFKSEQVYNNVHN